jgi:hypothetical protein
MPDGRDHGPLTADAWRRVCTVLDRVHDASPELRDATLEVACREHGLAIDDVKPFVDATAVAAALPEEIPLELIQNAFGDIAEEPPALRLDAGQRLGPYEVVGSLGRARRRLGFVFKKNARGQVKWIGPTLRPSGRRSSAG